MNLDNLTDKELIEQTLSGKTESFGVLVTRYERLLFAFLLTRSKDLNEIEDLVQETFIKAFRHLKSFDCDKKLAAWLVAIARNLLIDHHREAQKILHSTNLVTDTLTEKQQTIKNSGSSQPVKAVLRKETFKEICSMLTSLPEDLKEPFLLRIVDGLSYQELADTLQLPLQTVKNRIFKARTLLREKRDEKINLS